MNLSKLSTAPALAPWRTSRTRRPWQRRAGTTDAWQPRPVAAEGQ